ncbi:MAG TPA: ATP-dependent zinc metalloprotease FtsH [Bacteroidales bacterium]|nr:ATP-dependent zinc metalloprotease FtsH [Bacteroidales bacterium]HPW77741.1 ATP-dependent zinc metalloprotease FtsH [Bacteroidales bacterium]HQB55452.1 ATP-dependent zinc metalloprotease FtsH [Bacteroidales bacterium]
MLPVKKRFNPFFWVYIILIAVIVYFMFANRSGDPVKTEWITVKEQMGPRGEIEKLVYISNMQRAELYIRPDALEQYKVKFGDKVPKFAPQFYFIVSDNFDAETQFEQLRNSLPEEQRFKIEIEQRSSYWGRIIDWLLFPVLLVLMWIFMFRRMSRGSEGIGGGGGIFNVGRSQAKLFEKDKTIGNITFKDVAGLEEAKVEIMEIVDFLKNPERYTSLGGKIPKGVLLVGPPGTGKTLLAKAVAGEANVPFFSISGSDFVEMFVGVGASRVRDLFRQAKEKAPCIVFIDEIDAVGRARSKNVGFTSNDERENTLNQLLTEMDGFESNSGVIILAATNRADILDKALMRAGRFDRQIHVDLPEMKERLEIFKVHSRGLKLEEGFELEFLAKQTPGFSGADIANVCNEAALIAARKNKKSVQRQDFLDAIDRIVGGLERKSKIISPGEKRTIAFHESGHATVSWMLKHANPLLKVTIIPRGKALGAAWYLPEERHITTVEQMMDEMAAALGGRVAEELMIGQISTGAMNDLERVTRQAYAMVAYFGMSDKIGNVSFYDSTESAGFNLGKPYSETTAQLIDKEVRRIIDQAYEMARKVLNEHKEGFLKLADLLLEKEVIFADDLEAIFGKRQSAETKAEKDTKTGDNSGHID